MRRGGREADEVRERVIEGVRRHVESLRGKLRVLLAVVYGSFARGDWRKGGDVDLLVVAEGLPGTYWERWDALFAVVEGFLLDPHAYTPEEFLKLLADCRMTPIEALLDGVVVYADEEFYAKVMEELSRALK